MAPRTNNRGAFLQPASPISRHVPLAPSTNSRVFRRAAPSPPDLDRAFRPCPGLRAPLRLARAAERAVDRLRDRRRGEGAASRHRDRARRAREGAGVRLRRRLLSKASKPLPAPLRCLLTRPPPRLLSFRRSPPAPGGQGRGQDVRRSLRAQRRRRRQGPLARGPQKGRAQRRARQGRRVRFAGVEKPLAHLVETTTPSPAPLPSGTTSSARRSARARSARCASGRTS